MSAVEDGRTLIDDSGSLSDHEAQFQPKRGQPRAPAAAVEAPLAEAPTQTPEAETDKPTDLELAANPNLAYEQPTKRAKHRAAKSVAGPEDVPRIAELTRKRKEAEEETARLRTELETLRARPVTVPPAPATPSAGPAGPQGFTKPRPKLEDFAQESDPYMANVLANARWEREQDAWQARQQYVHGYQQQQQSALVGRITQAVQAFATKQPDYAQVVESIKHEQAPDLLLSAMAAGPETAPDFAADKFPEFVYALAKHPAVRYEMHLMTDGKPVTPQYVAIVRRALEARLQAGTTGAASPAVPLNRPPKPPTPVRTGPLKTGDEPPGDGSSLADHEAFFNQRRRRR